MPSSVSLSTGEFIPFLHTAVNGIPAGMYKEGHPINKYHVQTYGPLTKFGYKDFIPMFKAENFNADEWLAVVKSSGAQYIVPVAEHHDGFAMYSSTFNKWNAVDMGPKRDIIGELKEATKKAVCVSDFLLTDARMHGSMNMEWKLLLMFRTLQSLCMAKDA